MAYDSSFKPPDWWFKRLKDVMAEQAWDDPDVITMARGIDAEQRGHEKPWGADRLSKMRTTGKGTVELVVAISRAAKIPSPIVLPRSFEEAEALDRWMTSRRDPSRDPLPRKAVVVQALDSAVKAAKDQTKAVPSQDEGSPRDPRTRRASGRR